MDIGAHVGDDTRFYLDKGFAVVAVEANPVLVTSMKERFSEDIKKGFLTIEPFAIGSRDESMNFFVHKAQALFSSLTPNVELHGDEFDSIEVKCISAASVFRRHGTPHYMKIDIEGGELPVIEALQDFEKPKFVSIEVSADVDDCVRLLIAFGYDRFKILDQTHNGTLACPFPPREGRFVNTRFSGHMSGLFGRETTGHWITDDQITTAVRNIDWRFQHWYDIHATTSNVI
jgi:FkbM family methyltransferase